MRSHLILAVALAVAVCSVHAERHRHRRRRTTTPAPLPALLPDAREPAVTYPPIALPDREPAPVDQIRSEVLDEWRYQDKERERVQQAREEAGEGGDAGLDDPCMKVHCSAGRVCEIDEHGDAACVCIEECPHEGDARRKVCTNYNETWQSDCEVYQQRCLCMSNGTGCRGPQYHHVQIEYYGECREMPECSENEMADFPRRMRDWLFNIMRDMAERQELSPHYLTLEREAEADLARRWANAAVWKWCDLNAHDTDRFVSRHELFPIRAPLMALEHCIAPFLDLCDADSDHRVTLAEWGRCLQLDELELEERCDQFTDQAD